MLLILLLVANSSQALETLTHDSHGHENAAAMGVAIDSSAGMTSHGHHPDQAATDNPQAQDDECFCDEICCVSSVGFGAPITAGTSPQTSALNERLLNHYQSVSLDLLLPPPTPASL